MSRIFVTSDLHLGHANIIKYCNRPFTSVDEMNEALVDNWNKVVSTDDETYVIGDIFFGKKDKLNILEDFLSRMNGKKYLILGNHDHFSQAEYIKAGFAEVHSGFLNRCLNNQFFVMCHYQMASWEGSHYGAMHLFGHSHWTYQQVPPHDIYEKMGWSERKFNVCVDANALAPVALDEIIEILNKREINKEYKK